jgi:hypothetical protein
VPRVRIVAADEVTLIVEDEQVRRRAVGEKGFMIEAGILAHPEQRLAERVVPEDLVQRHERRGQPGRRREEAASADVEPLRHLVEGVQHPGLDLLLLRRLEERGEVLLVRHQMRGDR